MFLLVTLFTGANADLSKDIEVLSSAASVLCCKVSSWNSRAGLFAAMRIQRYFPTVSSAVQQLSRNAIAVSSSSDIDVLHINSFMAAISELLAILTKLAGDFEAVGVSWLVSRNLAQLGAPAADTVGNMFRVISHDPELVASLHPSLDAMADEFSSAHSAFGVSQVVFSRFM